MPVYEYTCSDCMSRFDLRRSISKRDLLAPCPNCQGINTARCISLPMVFAHAGNGEVKMVGGSGSACGSCVASSCAGCR